MTDHATGAGELVDKLENPCYDSVVAASQFTPNEMARRCANSPDREPTGASLMTTPIVAPTDSHDNTSIADADVLAWADALCEARDDIERAFVHEEDVSLKFHKAMYLHIEYCNTLAEIEQTVTSIRSMMERWTHRMDIDDRILDSLSSHRVVRILRAMPYDEYLKTDHWQAKRKEAIKHAHKRCQMCNADNRVLHVHHRTYDGRGQEALEDLIVLCADCHRVFHENREIAS